MARRKAPSTCCRLYPFSIGLLLAVPLSILLPGCVLRPSASSTREVGAVCALDRSTTPWPLVQRMSRAEYQATVNDILGASLDISRSLPIDEIANGFDNQAEALGFTATSLMSYQDVALSLADEHAALWQQDCAGTGNEKSCLEERVLEFGAKAYRRPLRSDEEQGLFRLAKGADAELTPLLATKAGIAAVLTAPQFLFRINPTSDKDQDLAYALASRLSYFLWSKGPNADLLEAASDGSLLNTTTVKQKIAEMTRSKASVNFVRRFGKQWLGTRELLQREPEGDLTNELLRDFETETLTYLNEFFHKNLNIRTFLTADFGFVNENLAKYYGLRELPKGFARLDLAGSKRGGLFGQGSFLVANANPSSTSPVKRGKWVLDNILCQPPPPPPEGVDNAAFAEVDRKAPMRERLAAHSQTKACAGCHAAIDPIGLSFENYDHRGLWRDSEAGQKIDASGMLSDGSKFNDFRDLAALLEGKSEFSRCVVQKLATFALGRAPGDSESCLVDAIAKKTEDPSYGLRDMVEDVAFHFLVP